MIYACGWFHWFSKLRYVHCLSGGTRKPWLALDEINFMVRFSRLHHRHRAASWPLWFTFSLRFRFRLWAASKKALQPGSQVGTEMVSVFSSHGKTHFLSGGICFPSWLTMMFVYFCLNNPTYCLTFSAKKNSLVFHTKYFSRQNFHYWREVDDFDFLCFH